jgi:hypothetical protein
MPYHLFGILLFLALVLSPIRDRARHLAEPLACPADQELIPLVTDTLLYVDNQGLTRIFITLNDQTFKLVADSAEVNRSQNAFPMPRTGEITINVAALIRPEETNCIGFTTQGPPGSRAETILAPVLIAGQDVAYAITGLSPLPTAFDLLYNYPNPFRERTTIVYEIPANRTTGLPVQLVVYDAVGRRVQTLVDGVRYPGRFTVTWSGIDAQGRRMASGSYFVHLIAGEFRQTIRLVVL